MCNKPRELILKDVKMKKSAFSLFAMVVLVPIFSFANWTSAPKIIKDFWVGPWPIVATTGTVLAVTFDNDSQIYYCLMNGNQPSKSIFSVVVSATTNGNTVYPSTKTCVPKSDGYTWCEIDGIHMSK
jgi:hypothetical protein